MEFWWFNLIGIIFLFLIDRTAEIGLAAKKELVVVNTVVWSLIDTLEAPAIKLTAKGNVLIVLLLEEP